MTASHANNATSEGQLTERVIQLMEIMGGLVDRGRTHSDVKLQDWAALGELVDREDFLRVGPFHDTLDWTGYTTMLTQWVNQSDGWNPVVKRLSEAPGVVFAQLEEMIGEGDDAFPFYSLSMYEFNVAMKIRRLYVYMQQEQSPVQGK